MIKLTKYKIIITILVLVIINFYIILNNNKSLKSNDKSIVRDDKNEQNNKYVNPHNFDYILNPGDKICSGHNVTLLAMVPISPHNFLNRLIIRTTWSSRSISSRLRVVFLIGYSSNKTVNEQIKKEFNQYGDIVQENFLDTYRNLTLKTIMGIKWVANYCSNAKFVMKIDDDMVINSPKLIEYLEHENNTHLTNTFLCNPLWKSEVIRDNTSKFYMSKEEFSADTYGVYCDGPAYIFTGDLANKLYETSLSTKTFVFEDVYIGMLASKLNSTFDEKFSWFYIYYDHNTTKIATHKEFDYYYVIYVDYYIDIVILWDLIQKRFYELYYNLDFDNLWF